MKTALGCATVIAMTFFGAMAAADPGQPVVRQIVLESTTLGRQHVVMVLPPDYEKGTQRYPAVLALAGLGESVRGNKAGAWGWVEKYGVVPAMAALHRNQLTGEDFQGLVSEQALKRYNDALAQDPYKGVILVCPYPPNLNKGFGQLASYQQFWLDQLMPHIDKTMRTTGVWGLGGISLGGLTATYVGFDNPNRFTAISSQQASIKRSRGRLIAMAKTNLEPLSRTRLNIATSHADGYRKDLERFDKDLRRMGLAHRFVILRGHHNKRFVKGPGSLEILLFHDRALRGSHALPDLSSTPQ